MTILNLIARAQAPAREADTLNPPRVTGVKAETQKERAMPAPNTQTRAEMSIDEITGKLDALTDRPAVVELVGGWVWVSFNSIPGAEAINQLKTIGFWWSPKHKKWYRPLSGKHFKAKASKKHYDEITRTYGVESLLINA